MRKIALVILALAAMCAAQQVRRGNISGVIVDPSNKPIIGAQVSVTGSAATDRTDDQGRFLFPLVGAGPYKLTVAFAGFKTAVEPDIQVKGSETTKFKVTMQPGSPDEVTAAVLSDDDLSALPAENAMFYESIPLPRSEDTTFINGEPYLFRTEGRSNVRIDQIPVGRSVADIISLY